MDKDKLDMELQYKKDTEELQKSLTLDLDSKNKEFQMKMKELEYQQKMKENELDLKYKTSLVSSLKDAGNIDNSSLQILIQVIQILFLKNHLKVKFKPNNHHKCLIIILK